MFIIIMNVMVIVVRLNACWCSKWCKFWAVGRCNSGHVSVERNHHKKKKERTYSNHNQKTKSMLDTHGIQKSQYKIKI